MDTKTGEVILEKKFYKSDFGEMLRDEKYKKYLLTAIDAALVTVGGEPSGEGDGEGGTTDE
jgi:hypothetical protein